MPHEREMVLERIKLLLEQTSKVKGKIINDHVILDIIDNEVHYWSPQLNFRIERNEDDPNQTILAGLIGPRPPVWTLFMFIYFAVGIVGFFISSYGVSKLMLGENSPFLWAFPIAIVFMFTAYKAGKYGEQLGKDQIEELKNFIRSATSFESNK